MDKLIIEGGMPLQGEVQIAGAKNAALPLMAAALLADGQTTLHNMPSLVDVKTMARVIDWTGAKTTFENGSLTIDASDINRIEAPYELVKTMRASFYMLGALLGRAGEAKVSLPGGCAWGPRPVDIHLSGMRALGAEIELDQGYIIAKGPLRGNNVVLDFPSVGATVNLLLAAVRAEGETVLENVAREPEITSLVSMLNSMGARITGERTSTLKIHGVDSLHAVTETVIPDRIEAGTYLVAAALTAGDVTLKSAEPEHLTMVLAKAAEAGVKFTVTTDGIRVEGRGALRAVDVETAVYPGFPTDMQAQWMTLMTGADGVSLVVDTIYQDRFAHVSELQRLGARVSMKENVARIHGPVRMRGAQVMSTDLRASASLVIAALAAEGTTEISRIYHLDRGYENLESKLEMLGAKIKRVSD